MVNDGETMATIADVKWWAVHRGVGHVLCSADGLHADQKWYSWGRWACDKLVSGGAVQKEPPERLCRKCMANLKTSTVRKAKA